MPHQRWRDLTRGLFIRYITSNNAHGSHFYILYCSKMLHTNHLRIIPWWRHQMETFSALLAICAGNSSVIGEFPTQRPVTRSFDVFIDLRPNKRLSKQSWGCWFETPSRPLWRHRNVMALWQPYGFSNVSKVTLKIKENESDVFSNVR